MTIITTDRDYADAAKFPGPPPRVVRLKVLNDRTAATELYLREHAAEIEPRRQAWASDRSRSNASTFGSWSNRENVPASAISFAA